MGKIGTIGTNGIDGIDGIDGINGINGKLPSSEAPSSSEAILSSEAPPFILLKSQKELFSLLFEAFELFFLFGPCPPQSAHYFSLEVLRLRLILSNYRSAAPTTVAIFDLKSRGKRLSVRCTRLVSMMTTRSFSGSMTIDVPVAPV